MVQLKELRFTCEQGTFMGSVSKTILDFQTRKEIKISTFVQGNFGKKTPQKTLFW